jgi:TonB family protein
MLPTYELGVRIPASLKEIQERAVVKLHRELLYACALIALILPAAAYGKISDQDLRNEYEGKVLTLRRPYWGPRLHFNSAGDPSGETSIGSWTIAGQVRVRGVDVKNGVLRLRGQRLFLFYDPASKSLRDAGSLAKGDPASKYFRGKISDWVASVGKVEIELETGEPEPTMADVARSMNTVFLSPGELLTDAVPVFWKKWLEPRTEPSKAAANGGAAERTVSKVGHGVTAPHLKYDPDPQYSGVGREAKYQGTSVLWLIVGEDGAPRDIRIAKPLGMGLDDEAVRTVATWKFDPAMKDGTPVPVMINVEVNFRLH